MKPVLSGLLAAFVVLGAANTARASDHNNVDAGRPLGFDDAESIAFGERDWEFGAGLGGGRGRRASLGLSAEYLFGFALNSHVSVAFDPSFGGRAGGTSDARADLGDIGVGVFHNFNREYGRTPALSVRGDAFLPTGRDSRGVNFRLRAIASRSFRQYARLHLNVDANIVTRPGASERAFWPAVTLGYSAPLGFPARFDRTLLAELSYQNGEETGQSGRLAAGIGVRQQVSVRSVLDAGVQSDLVRFSGTPGESVRVVAGYSTAF